MSSNFDFTIDKAGILRAHAISEDIYGVLAKQAVSVELGLASLAYAFAIVMVDKLGTDQSTKVANVMGAAHMIDQMIDIVLKMSPPPAERIN